MRDIALLSAPRGVFSRLRRRMSPAQFIAGSFLLAILAGTLLLILPISVRPGARVGFVDALFTAVSAVCLTGLMPLNTAATWTLFGKGALLLLMQLGGLTFITVFTFFVVQMGRKVTLKNRLAIQAAFNIADLRGMVRMVMFIIRGTLICEGIGALLLFCFFLSRGVPPVTALGWGVFHTVSAFCNGGFDVIGSESFSPYADSAFFNLVVMALIFLGGIGFAVWRDVYEKLVFLLSGKRGRRPALSVHSKLALATSAVLVLGGALYFFLAEYDNPATLGPFAAPGKALRSLFQSVSLRTAGFYTFPQEGLHEPSKLVSAVLMLIGGSPGGTAGGMRTVTAAVVVCSVWSTLRGFDHITVFRRSLPDSTLKKSLTVIAVMLFLCLASATLLSVTEFRNPYGHGISDILYEVTSAFGAGQTTGLTPHLSAPGKLVVILCMYVGRIGPITILVSFANRAGRVGDRIKYQDTDIMIG